MTIAAPDPAGSIRLLDVYAEQIKIGGQLQVIHEQLKPIPDHESRIRALERFRFTLMGTAIIGGAASGFGGYLIGHLVR